MSNVTGDPEKAIISSDVTGQMEKTKSSGSNPSSNLDGTAAETETKASKKSPANPDTKKSAKPATQIKKNTNGSSTRPEALTRLQHLYKAWLLFMQLL